MNDIYKWLQENIQRLFIKSPKLFRWWQRIWFILILITGIPKALTVFKIILPEPWNTTLSDIVLYASSGALFMAKLPVQSPDVAVTKEGDVLKKTDEKKLTFTAESEKKEANKEGGVLNEATPTSREVIEKKDEPIV